MIARRLLAIHKVPAHIVLLTALASYAAQVLAVILHFLYNLIETMPLVAAFAYQANRIYNEWLPHAFPDLPEPLLIETTDRLQTMWFRPGEVIVREGDVADRLYIVSTGEVEVLRRDRCGGAGDRPRDLRAHRAQFGSHG